MSQNLFSGGIIKRKQRKNVSLFIGSLPSFRYSHKFFMNQVESKPSSAEEFLNWTRSQTVGPEIEYVLDFKSNGGRAQYLVRYVDKVKYPYDVWEDNCNVLNTEKVNNYWEKKNPELQPNLDPSWKEDESEEEDSKETAEKKQLEEMRRSFKIHYEKIVTEPSDKTRVFNPKRKGTTLYFPIVLPGTTEILAYTAEQFKKELPNEAREYYEQYIKDKC